VWALFAIYDTPAARLQPAMPRGPRPAWFHLALFGIFLWTTILTFDWNLWNLQRRLPTPFEPCNDDLYRVVSGCLLFLWSALGLYAVCGLFLFMAYAQERPSALTVPKSSAWAAAAANGRKQIEEMRRLAVLATAIERSRLSRTAAPKISSRARSAALSLTLFAGSAVLGGLFVAFGAQNVNSHCEAGGLAAASIALGSVLLFHAAMSLLEALFPFGFGTLSILGLRPNHIVRAVVLALFLWATIIAFRDNLWARQRTLVNVGVMDRLLPCDRNLYFNVSGLLIFFWGILGYLPVMGFVGVLLNLWNQRRDQLAEGARPVADLANYQVTYWDWRRVDGDLLSAWLDRFLCCCGIDGKSRAQAAAGDLDLDMSAIVGASILAATGANANMGGTMTKNASAAASVAASRSPTRPVSQQLSVVPSPQQQMQQMQMQMQQPASPQQVQLMMEQQAQMQMQAQMQQMQMQQQQMQPQVVMTSNGAPIQMPMSPSAANSVYRGGYAGPAQSSLQMQMPMTLRAVGSPNGAPGMQMQGGRPWNNVMMPMSPGGTGPRLVQPQSPYQLISPYNYAPTANVGVAAGNYPNSNFSYYGGTRVLN
jgi:hypothetical protein